MVSLVSPCIRWSLGVVLFAMLVGMLPYDEEAALHATHTALHQCCDAPCDAPCDAVCHATPCNAMQRHARRDASHHLGLLPLDAPPDPQASRDDPLFVELRAAQLRGASPTRALCRARQLPCTLPAPAIALVDALLCVAPARRPTIEEVGRHAWLAEPRPSPLMAVVGGFFACIPAAARGSKDA